jgi:3-methyladenine DNA glycosylase AlkD
MNKLLELQRGLKNLADPERAKLLQGYFKTGKGEYGEGDIFLGLTVPAVRATAKKYVDLSFEDIKSLLVSKFHEERLIALLILVQKFNKGDEKKQKEVYEFYLNNTEGINNWDLVDLSSHEIIGKYLLRGPVKGNLILFKLAKSKNIWERRIACISTFEFIRNNRLDDSMKLAEMLVNDRHDLMHKAVGWMLREVGKKDLEAELKFLDKHYRKMPRTMLRYAIEKLPEKQRLAYLKKD